MAKSLVDLLVAKQDADRRELETLTSLAVEDFGQEQEARATALAQGIADRQPQIDAAREAAANAEASNRAAVEAGEVGKEERVASPAVVTREERTYSPERSARGETSFFVDAFKMREHGDLDARSRLERHAREVMVEGEISKRATTTASFAGLIVPQYLVDQAALVARAGRPFANTVQHLPLPDQGTVFYIPKGTTGASTAVQASENTNVSSTDEVWANVQVNVVTIAGQQDISRQSLDRGTPGIDSLIYLDLAAAYAVTLDTQCLTATGTGTKGILNSGLNTVSAFTAAATPATFYTKLAGAINAVQTSRFLAPTMIAMHPRRWNWLVGQSDSSQRPLVVPVANGPYNATGLVNGGPQDVGQAAIVGYIQGLPVVCDASLPTAVGTGPEDQVVVYRQSDSLLWEEGDGMPRQLRFEQTLGNQLTVKLVVYGYMAFTAERFPTGASVIGGNAGTAGFGLVAPTF